MQLCGDMPFSVSKITFVFIANTVAYFIYLKGRIREGKRGRLRDKQIYFIHVVGNYEKACRNGAGQTKVREQNPTAASLMGSSTNAHHPLLAASQRHGRFI